MKRFSVFFGLTIVVFFLLLGCTEGANDLAMADSNQENNSIEQKEESAESKYFREKILLFYISQETTQIFSQYLPDKETWTTEDEQELVLEFSNDFNSFAKSLITRMTDIIMDDYDYYGEDIKNNTAYEIMRNLHLNGYITDETNQKFLEICPSYDSYEKIVAQKMITWDFDTLDITLEDLYAQDLDFLKGKLVHVLSSDQILLDWFFYIPKEFDSSKRYDFYVNGINSASVNGDYEAMKTDTQNIMMSNQEFAEVYDYVLLSIAVPRNTSSPEIPDYYGAGLDRKMYYYPDHYPEAWLRPEDQLVKIQDTLNAILANNGISTNEKMILEGFSAGGMFAQKFALVYPERVKAIAAGQCGGVFTMPVSEHSGKKLRWPIGIYDYEEIFGKPFDEAAYKEIQQFIYIADGDIHNSMASGGGDGNGYFVQSDLDFINAKFGREDPTKLQNTIEYLNSIGYENIHFYTYPGEGHVDLWDLGEQQIVIDFLEQYR